MEREKIVIELCGGRMPEKAHDADAAYDVFTKEDVKVLDYERYAIPLGFKIQLPKHLAAVIQPRSGLSSEGMYVKRRYHDGLVKEERIDADVKLGLIDSGYTGEVKAIVKTYGICSYMSYKIIIPAGTRIAQMRIVQVPSVMFEVGTIEKDTERGEHGFNSTGTK